MIAMGRREVSMPSKISHFYCDLVALCLAKETSADRFYSTARHVLERLQRTGFIVLLHLFAEANPVLKINQNCDIFMSCFNSINLPYLDKSYFNTGS
jgi:hypothetical protein